jgi:hypothetical protein
VDSVELRAANAGRGRRALEANKPRTGTLINNKTIRNLALYCIDFTSSRFKRATASRLSEKSSRNTCLRATTSPSCPP